MPQDAPLDVENPDVEIGHEHKDPLVLERSANPDVVDLRGRHDVGRRSEGDPPHHEAAMCDDEFGSSYSWLQVLP